LAPASIFDTYKEDFFQLNHLSGLFFLSLKLGFFRNSLIFSRNSVLEGCVLAPEERFESHIEDKTTQLLGFLTTILFFHLLLESHMFQICSIIIDNKVFYAFS